MYLDGNRRDIVPVPDPSWHEDAACKGVGGEKFFRDERGPYTNLGWEPFCRACPVRSECLAHSFLMEEQWGIWGGFTPNARRRLFSELLEGTVMWDQIVWALTMK